VYEQHLGVLRDRSSKGLKRATMDKTGMRSPSKELMDQAYTRYRWIVNYWMKFDIGDNEHDGFIEPRDRSAAVDAPKRDKRRRVEKGPQSVDDVDWSDVFQ
jgi:hypothetical protein